MNHGPLALPVATLLAAAGAGGGGAGAWILYGLSAAVQNPATAAAGQRALGAAADVWAHSAKGSYCAPPWAWCASVGLALTCVALAFGAGLLAGGGLGSWTGWTLARRFQQVAPATEPLTLPAPVRGSMDTQAAFAELAAWRVESTHSATHLSDLAALADQVTRGGPAASSSAARALGADAADIVAWARLWKQAVEGPQRRPLGRRGGDTRARGGSR
jgi:hypothetical protein